MPRLRAARMMRQAISPRLATKIVFMDLASITGCCMSALARCVASEVASETRNEAKMTSLQALERKVDIDLQPTWLPCQYLALQKSDAMAWTPLDLFWCQDRQILRMQRTAEKRYFSSLSMTIFDGFR